MKIKTILLASSISILSFHTHATVLYQTDFQSGSNLNAYGMSVNFGSPAVQHVFGAASDTQLVFNNPTGNFYEQIQLTWPTLTPGGNYKISFDLMTQNLVDSQYSFTMLLDTPIVQNLYFGGYGNDIYSWNPIGSGPSSVGNIGKLKDNIPMHVEINVNLNQLFWNVAVDGIGQAQIPFYTSSGGIKDLRFSIAPWSGNAAAAPNVSVALDNLHISNVPLPGAGSLLMSALAAIAIRTRRQREK